MSELLLLVHAAATWFMVGLIWFVQIVHYPLFSGVGADGWIEYERRHTMRTGWVVLPVMLVELITAALIAFGVGVEPMPRLLPWVGVAMLAAVWISTFAVQVPLHAKLGAEHAPRAMRALVLTNWLRTVLWSGRGVLAAWMLA